MRKESLNFLTSLLETPSVSGYEQKIQKVVKRRMRQTADTIDVDVHGNLIAAYNPDAKVRVMLAGHCDQIGMMVTYIDDSGFIRVKAVGGIDASVLPGCKLTIHTDSGPIPAVIGHKPVHLLSQSERGKKVDIKDVWVDLGSSSGEETKKLVRIGDSVTYELGVQRLGKHAIASPGCDDRVGTFVVMEALRLYAEARKKKRGSSSVGLFAVSTVQEEIGLRGAKTAAYGIDPLVGIAVDVTHASDNPGADAKEVGVVELGKGPTISRGPNINPIIEELLLSTAKKKKIPHQVIGAPRATGTDANAIQITKSGVAAALIGLPNRYMHTSVEVVDLRDLEKSAQLIAETVLQITGKTSFVPV